MIRFRKSDIEFHSDRGFGEVHAAVNVKLHRWVYPDPAQVAAEEGYAEPEESAKFASAWEALPESEKNAWADAAIENGWDKLQEIAKEIFGAGAAVYSEGRSSGWAVVCPGFERYTAADRIPEHVPFTRAEVESWDAIRVSRWGRFAQACRRVCDDLPYQAIFLYLANDWERAAAELETARRFAFYYAEGRA